MTNTHNDETSGEFAPLLRSKYMLLTTFRRDGSAVSTPVHLVAEPDVVFFRTWDVSGKAKRLRNAASVEIAPCNVRGHRRGEPIRAKAVLLEGEASEQAARRLAHKHPLMHGRLIPWFHRKRGWTTQQYRVEPA
ncbi:MAG TPA: PPOX class F420-dependent oxidoreductase [Acidimicrobiales bacterium]|nr:PPOX class F420-dependent oxidoreductase [Acidimicrobiales bacterium]